MALSTEAIIALIVSGLALIGTIFTFIQAARKNDLDILRGIISELRDRIQELEDKNGDLEAWAEALCCQVKELGHDPVKFMRKDRNPTQPRKLVD